MHYKNWQIYLNFLVFNLYRNKTNSEIFSHLANNYLSKTSFWYLYSLLGTYFTPFSTVSIVDFEQETVCWVTINFWNHFISIYITDQKILMNLLIYPKGNLQYFEKIRNRKKIEFGFFYETILPLTIQQSLSEADLGLLQHPRWSALW